MQAVPSSDPRFEGFVIRIDSSATKQEVRTAVDIVLGDQWQVEPIPYDPSDFEVTSEHVQLTDQEAWQATYRLRAAPAVLYAEPVFAVSIMNRDDWLTPAIGEPQVESVVRDLCFNDPLLAESDDPVWSLHLTRVLEAWNRFFPDATPGQGIVIGHPDTGYVQHPEIAGNLLVDLGFDFVRNDRDARDELEQGPGFNPGHGTGTASVIVSPGGAAGGAGNQGVTGVAPGAKLIPIRVARSVVLLLSTFDLAHAIEHAVNQGAHVISISMGGVFNYRLHKAVVYAQRHGVIVLAAAGNCVRFVVWPAAYDEVIAVAASNAQNKPWRGSSRGAAVDVTAPGQAVWRAVVATDGSLGVERGTGTSFAVATVAGIAALWLAHHGRDKLVRTYGAAKLPVIFHQLLRTTCAAVTGPEWSRGSFGSGLVDAVALLAAPLPGTPEGPVVAPVFELQEHVPIDRGGLATFNHLFERSLSRERQNGPVLEGIQADDPLQTRLAELLSTTEAELPVRLREVGQELAFYLAVNPDLYKRFESVLTNRSTVLESPAPVPEGSRSTASAVGVREGLLAHGVSLALGAKLMGRQ